MRLRALLREAMHSMWSAKVPTALIVMVVAAMCFASLVTVGKSAAAAVSVAQRMEQAGARRLTIIDGRTSGFINARTLRSVQHLNTVDNANALAEPVDVVNGHIGRGAPPVSLWPVIGELSNTVSITRGRLPRAGEAIVSTKQLATLGLTEPVGYLTTLDGLRHYSVVGAFTPRPPFDDLSDGAVTPASPHDSGRELRATISTITATQPTVTAIIGILNPTEIKGVEVDSPTQLADTARELDAQLRGYGRSLLLLILAVGGFFVAAVVLADVLISRKDLGRRRTLGASRADLAALVTLRAALTAALGAAVGCAFSWGFNLGTGSFAPLNFTIAIGILASLTASIAAFLPAAYAARRDPVAVMRTP